MIGSVKSFFRQLAELRTENPLAYQQMLFNMVLIVIICLAVMGFSLGVVYLLVWGIQCILGM